MLRRFLGLILALTLLTAISLTVKRFGTSSLTLQLQAASRIHRGGILRTGLLLRNRATTAAEIVLSGRPAYDFAAVDSSGVEVWRWSHDKAVQQILQIREIGPGQEFLFEDRWDLRSNAGTSVPPGTYRLIGFLRLEDRTLSDVKALVIEP